MSSESKRFGYGYRMRHQQHVVNMALHFVRNGVSCTQTAYKIAEIYGVTVNKVTIAEWAKKDGIMFQGRCKLKGCEFCGSRTLHKHNCPTYKQIYEETRKRRKDNKYVSFTSRVLGH